MDEENKNLPVPEDPEGPEEAKEPEKLENIVYDWARSLAAAVVSVVLLFAFGVRLIGVSGPSMQDTLYTGDRLVVLGSLLSGFEAGDVVVVNDYNAELSETIVKRIIAVGGQTVDIDFASGVVYVDGEALEEPYIREDTHLDLGMAYPFTVPEGCLFLMGDNRNESRDSREPALGAVDERCVIGRAVFLLLPGETAGLRIREWDRIGTL